MGSGESAEETAAFFKKNYGMNDLTVGVLKVEYPQHRVWITKPFYLGTYHVTRGQFRQFVKESGYKTDAEKGERPGAFGWDPDKQRLRVHSAGGPIQAQRLRTLRHAWQCLSVVRGLVRRGLLRQIGHRRPNRPKQRRWPRPSGRILGFRAVLFPFRLSRLERAGQPEQLPHGLPCCRDSVIHATPEQRANLAIGLGSHLPWPRSLLPSRCYTCCPFKPSVALRTLGKVGCRRTVRLSSLLETSILTAILACFGAEDAVPMKAELGFPETEDILARSRRGYLRQCRSGSSDRRATTIPFAMAVLASRPSGVLCVWRAGFSVP